LPYVVKGSFSQSFLLIIPDLRASLGPVIGVNFFELLVILYDAVVWNTQDGEKCAHFNALYSVNALCIFLG